jgi:1-deoxy-D-xylulose-5-phosphate synthase
VILREGRDCAILAVGVMCEQAMRAAELLDADGFDVTVVNCRFIKPLDRTLLETVVGDHSVLLTAEDGIDVNGFGAYVAATVEGIDRDVRVDIAGVPDRTYEHAPRGEQLAWAGLDAESLAQRVRALAAEESLSSR